MKTLGLHVVGANGKKVKARPLYDEGTQRSYVRTQLARRLGCQDTGKIAMQSNLFGGHKTAAKIKQNYRVQVQGIDRKYREILQLEKMSSVLGVLLPFRLNLKSGLCE
jgi:hypothetical protein